MATFATPEQVTEVYNQVEKDFKTGMMSIHNLLWQIIVNRVGEERNFAFSNVYADGKHFIVRVEAGESGYYNSHVEFADHLTYDSAYEVCEYLNKAVYGLSKDEMCVLVAQSFELSII